MSIETDLSSIAKSLAAIANHLLKEKINETPISAPAPVVTHSPAPVTVPVSVSTVPSQPVPAAVVEEAMVAAPAMFAPVSFATITAPAAVQDAVIAPAAPVVTMTAAEFNQFVVESYEKLGPVKGKEIQTVLASFGAKTLSSISADKYAAVIDGIKALMV